MTNTNNATEIRKQVERANEKFMETYSRGDAEGMAELYTRDGMVLPPNGDFVEGRQQIQEFWKAIMKGVKSVKLEIREVEQHGNTAYEVSRATLFDEKGQTLDQAKYIVIWKQENGQWKLHRDIFNSSQKAQ